MQEIFEQANAVLDEITASAPTTAEELEQFRIKYLGTKSILKDLFGAMGKLPNEKKKEYGQLMNALKDAAQTKFDELTQSLAQSKSTNQEIPDLTAPGYDMPLGTRHPLAIIKNKMIDIFARIGFVVAEGPEFTRRPSRTGYAGYLLFIGR